ncbi:hypothetical protein BGLY_1225 [Bacillus glycinifermentans]|nr:hypothetical protein TH62_12900 [Bacillus sp. TH008]SCA85048.1 hypothetical protein BGLY_1225 [Bacillus glycinifermentans]
MTKDDDKKPVDHNAVNQQKNRLAERTGKPENIRDQKNRIIYKEQAAFPKESPPAAAIFFRMSSRLPDRFYPVSSDGRALF